MPTPITMPISEVADRYTIALLKRQRLPAKEAEAFEAQVQFYLAGLDIPDNTQLHGLVLDLQDINGQIWDVEHSIRKGLDDELGMDEIGRRAVEIRNLNRQRIAIKNQITRLTGSGFEDCKMNYAG